MWSRLSLVTRLALLQSGILIFLFLLALPGVLILSSLQLEKERESLDALGLRIAHALNAAAAASDKPISVLNAFAAELGGEGEDNIRYVPAESNEKLSRETESEIVPRWFSALISTPQNTSYPVVKDGRLLGNVVVVAEGGHDLSEKWYAFVATISLSVLLIVFGFVMARAILGSVVGPLQQIAMGLGQLRQENYSGSFRSVGPPEIRLAFDRMNELARKLKTLSEDNRTLIQRIINLQETERHQISQELHDELGPLLFALRANASALASSVEFDTANLAERSQAILKVVETLQAANRRILDRMRPISVRELGLVRSLESLFRGPAFALSNLKLNIKIDPAVDEIGETLGNAIYRIVQEALTNVLRHAKASQVSLSVTSRDAASGAWVDIEIADDGIGAPARFNFGRGLTGMQQRVSALDGKFRFDTGTRGSTIHVEIPIAPFEV
jgi:two-component system sensor histidine kinase UhpB